MKKLLDSQLEKEIRAIRGKYEAKSIDLYRLQNEIIEGVRELNASELPLVDEYLHGEELADKLVTHTKEPLIGYWYRALKNCANIAQEIKEKDESILRLLNKIEYELIEQTDDFQLMFHFNANSHFSNTYLKKKFIMQDGENPYKSEGTLIDWQEGKNVTRKLVNRKVKNPDGGFHTQQQVMECESFFNFFKNIDLEDKEVIEKFQLDQKSNKVADRMDTDYNIARIIIDELLPYSLEYYFGLAKDNDDINDLDLRNQQDSDDES